MKENNCTPNELSIASKIANTIFGTLAETPNIITKNPRALNMFVSFWYATFCAQKFKPPVPSDKFFAGIKVLLSEHYEGLKAEFEAEENRTFIPKDEKTSDNKQFVYQTLARLYPVVFGADAPETEENKFRLEDGFNMLVSFLDKNTSTCMLRNYYGCLPPANKSSTLEKQHTAECSSSDASRHPDQAPSSSASSASSASTEVQSSGDKLSTRQIVGIVLLVLQALALLGASISGSLAGAGIFELLGFFIFGIVGLILLLKK